MLKKRGAIEIQFNWIFVLIIGALILGFFGKIVYNQIQLSKEETDIAIQTKLKTIIKNAKESTGSVFEVNLKRTEIRYNDCTEGLETGGTLTPIKITTAFAPNLVKSATGKVYFWAVDWNMPYRVENFIFITSPDIKYVVVNTSEDTEKYALEIYNGTQVISLPDRFNKLFMDFDEAKNLQPNNYYKTRFIFFDVLDFHAFNPQNSFFLDDAIDVSAVLINPTSGNLDGYGDVEYRVKKTTSSTLEYVGDSKYLARASMFGAIISENISHYDCVMEEAIERLNLVSLVYKKRTENLQTQLPVGGDCTDYGIYPLAAGHLQNIIDMSTIFKTDNFVSIYTDAFSDAGSVKTLNHLAIMKSCPLVY